MKKMLLAIAMMVASFTVKAQSTVNGRVITHSTSTQTMVWSESENRNIYFDQRERYLEDNLVEISLNSQTASGKVVVTNINDGDAFAFNIYDYEFRPNQFTDEGDAYDTFVIDCIEANTGTKARIVWLSYQSTGIKVISVFMPTEQLVVHMDTER